MKKVAKREKIDDEILGTLSEEIDSHVDRAARIIQHMRQFGRKSDLKLEQIQLNDVLEKSFEMFSQQLMVRGIEVDWKIDENLPLIMADAGRLEQVFINLLINARDAIEEKWELNPPQKGHKKITLKTRFAENRVNAEVQDSGAGVAESIIDKVFEPFFTTKNAGKGTGLGLSISYRIVQDLGGKIAVVSPEGEGARFIVSFPAASENNDEGAYRI